MPPLISCHGAAGGRQYGRGMTTVTDQDLAEVVLPCPDLDAALAFFCDRLGFDLDMIMPADAPTTAVLSGHGLRIRLQPNAGADPGELRIAAPATADGEGPTTLIAPNGTRIHVVAGPSVPVLPVAVRTFELTRADPVDGGVGRAGMHYRDLLPGRQGGRFIASHIIIPDAGPVPDYVHHHSVRFQMIFCARGWVEVVYEDQGPPFRLHAGDCVLQPPNIRHRVLAASAGVEVVEIGCPAEHETRADRSIPLPTAQVRPERIFGGQRFVRHIAAEADYSPWRLPGYEYRDTGIGSATTGLAGSRVVRPIGSQDGGTAEPTQQGETHEGELLFWFVLDGSLTLHLDGHGDYDLRRADALAVPAGSRYEVSAASADLELLEVSLPDLLPVI